jgi:hypothetical protein
MYKVMLTNYIYDKVDKKEIPVILELEVPGNHMAAWGGGILISDTLGETSFFPIDRIILIERLPDP